MCVNRSIQCPNCVPRGTRRKWTPALTDLEHNYSGTGVDVMQCPECRVVFMVTYEVADVTRAPDVWQEPTPTPVGTLARDRSDDP